MEENAKRREKGEKLRGKEKGEEAPEKRERKKLREGEWRDYKEKVGMR
ncbi:hypothetical protein [Escherichia coli]|nr:hypothetical protein [Escherichia coli]